MLELEISGQRTPVPVGELVIGSDPSCGLRVFGERVKARHAVVVGSADGSAAVRRSDAEAEILVNGVRLGGDPAPILHGDKLQIGPNEILVTDPRRGGSTQFVNAAQLARMAGAAGAVRPARAQAPTAATGGRLVCLTDGREYTIGATAVVLGREAGCDIVVPSKDVSRRHAEILASPRGYVLVDSSTNGTFVNGERVEGQRILARADVIRIGDHEFRFYADRAAEAPPPSPEAEAQVAPAASPAASAAGAAARLSDTMFGVGTAQPAGAPPTPEPRASGGAAPLGTLIVRSGQLKGARFPIRVPVVNIGRADFNDIVIPDESVSGMHAKLQRREGIWVITDNDSTNGTFVDGERVRGEVPLSPGAIVRFGEVSVMFEPTDDHLGTAAGTGTKVIGAIRPGQGYPAEAGAGVSWTPAARSSPSPSPSPSLPPAPVPEPEARARVSPFPPERSPAAPAVPAAPATPPSRVATPMARRSPVIVSSPPRRQVPSWVLPAIVVAVLVVLAFVLLSR